MPDMYGSWFIFVLILVSSLPSVTVYAWFRLAKYQFSLIRFLFALLAGAAAFFPALILQRFLNFPLPAGRAALFYHVFVRIALTEEFSRLLMMLLFLFISSRFRRAANSDQLISYNEVKRGTAAGLVAGLGFAILETSVYAASNINVLLLRIVTAVLHGACGSRIGAAAVMLRSNPIQALMRILTAAAIHGIYNMMAGIRGLPSIAAVLIALSAFVTSIITIHGGWVENNLFPSQNTDEKYAREPQPSPPPANEGPPSAS